MAEVSSDKTSFPAVTSEDRRRLWVVTELYFPEETSTGYYLTRISEGLSDEFDVKALCGQPNYSSRGKRAAKRERRNGVEIFRAAGTTLNKNVIVFRLINMMTLSVSIFLKAVRKFRAGDRVLVVTTPPSLPFVVAAASLIKGSQYTLLIHDNYPEILFAVGKMKETSFVAGVLNFFNRWLYKHATKMIAVGRDMKELLTVKTAGLDIPIVVIPNWAELETVEPAPRNKNRLLRDLGLLDKFVLLYAGNMGYPNDLESIIECASYLAQNPDIHFIFLGSGVKEKWLRQEVSDRGLSNVTILEPKPRSEQIVFLNACDVAIVSLVTRMRGVSMPSRTYNILAAGKPMLALTEPESELAMVIDEDRVGWHLVPGEPATLSALIQDIYSDRKEIAAISKRARNVAVEKYSLGMAITHYKQEFGFVRKEIA